VHPREWSLSTKRSVRQRDNGENSLTSPVGYCILRIRAEYFLRYDDNLLLIVFENVPLSKISSENIFRCWGNGEVASPTWVPPLLEEKKQLADSATDCDSRDVAPLATVLGAIPIALVGFGDKPRHSFKDNADPKDGPRARTAVATAWAEFLMCEIDPTSDRVQNSCPPFL
jgi:hypothetical protein